MCKVSKALLTEQVLDDKGLTTLMCEVEAMVNGRPITKVSDDPCDLEPLTPNHLLLLRAGPSVPSGTFSKQDKTVFRARNRLKDSSRAKDVYIRLRKSDTAGKESINQSDVPSEGAMFERKSY